MRVNALKQNMKTIVAALSIAGASLGASPAAAQIFLKSPNFSGAPVTTLEPGVVLPLPGASPEETRAALLWSLRAGLNVAALQCQFDPTLLTLNQYNYLLADHGTELNKAYTTLTGYFKKQNKNAKAALTALDQYGTRTYLGFSTVRGQLGFCLTASRIGRAALFSPRDGLGNLATLRLREFRNSLLPAGEQQFPRFLMPYYTLTPIRLEDKCWDKKGQFNARKCR